MAQVERDDPCPCGSGKKYKRCCLPESYSEASEERSLNSKLIKKILDFAKRRFNSRLDDAFDYYWSDFDPEEKLDDGIIPFAMINYHEWLTYDWIPDIEDGRTVIEHFLEKSKRLTPAELRVLNVMKNALISLYEVQEVFPEKGLLLKDLLMGGEYDVKETAATRSLRRWDIFATRLLYLDGKYIMSGCVYPYDTRQKEAIVKAIKRWLGKYKKDFPGATFSNFLKAESDLFNFLWYDIIRNPRLPQLITTTGEPLLWSEAVFAINDRAAVIEGLKTIKEFRQEDDEFMWYAACDKYGSVTVLGRIFIKGKNLILECNSKERLERGKITILSHISHLVKHLLDTFQDPYQAMKSHKDLSKEIADIDTPAELQQEQEIYTRLMKRYSEEWLEKEIPALGGKTPLEAVKTKKGREKVIELLKSFENKEEHNKRSGRPYYDLTWMWERLGLERE